MASPLLYFVVILLVSYIFVTVIAQNYPNAGEFFEEVIGGFAKGKLKRQIATTTTTSTTTQTTAIPTTTTSPLITTVPLTTTSVTSTSTITTTTTTLPPASQKNIGVNYLTLYHFYETPQSILDRDFSRFKSDGINTIVILVFWYRVESSPGVYNQNFINNVIRVANTAGKYGIKVMIDFHTLIGDTDAWSNPQYIGVAKLAYNETKANAYISMVKWAVTQLKDVPNIQSYSLLNEPWYWPLEDWRKANWINLAVNLSKTVKMIDSRPVTIRFVAPLFERDWGWNATLLNALDFLSMNAYDYSWNVDGHEGNITYLSQQASIRGKGIQITEFGESTWDDNLQTSYYKNYTHAFNSTIPKLMGWLNWGWEAEYDPNNLAWDAIGSFAINDRITRNPRPAYNELVQNIY